MGNDRQIDPAALSPDDLARVLSQGGAEGVNADLVRADIAGGAPVNPDGTINLVHYTAWLVQQASG